MAKNTDTSLRNQVLYSIYIRNHTSEGTFKALIADLDRIKSLGTDYIWLLPIHPIGKLKRKGSLGCPYAIQDYRKVNPEYGSLEDFTLLVDEIHKRGMKCIIDVVYNHTSPDSWLAENHGEWFYHKADGSFGNKTGDWGDVIDLDYNKNKLWEYQIETLKYWAGIVDGFRCDVASLIPLDFWLKAREEVSAVRKDCLWLAESVEPGFTAYNRLMQFTSISDSEIFESFDVSYDYDIFPWFKGYLEGKNSLTDYIEKINEQETIYPVNYVKLKFLENHDRSRACFLFPDEKVLRNWTAFLYFQKGMTMIYAGQEKGNINRPGLFDKDLVEWNTGVDFSDYFSALYKIKKDPLFANSFFSVKYLKNDIVLASHERGGRKICGVFSLAGLSSVVSVDLPGGVFTNLLNESAFSIEDGNLSCTGYPVIFECSREVPA